MYTLEAVLLSFSWGGGGRVRGEGAGACPSLSQFFHGCEMSPQSSDLVGSVSLLFQTQNPQAKKQVDTPGSEWLERTRRVSITVGENVQCPQAQAGWISSVDERKDTLLIFAQQFGLMSFRICFCTCPQKWEPNSKTPQQKSPEKSLSLKSLNIYVEAPIASRSYMYYIQKSHTVGVHCYSHSIAMKSLRVKTLHRD